MMPIVEAHRLGFRYPGGDWVLKDIHLSVAEGATVGIVGESGSGKSTLIRVLCGLLPPGAGSARFDQHDLTGWRRRSSVRQFRRQNQMVFQSPASSFDPRMRMRQSLAEPIRAIERRRPGLDEVTASLAEVGLGPEILPRYPHQLSGGQLQRVALARALSLRPRVLYADEPTSALDVSVQAQVLNLLMDLRARLGLTLVMVSHDLAVISRLCEQIVVMKDGVIVEAGETVRVLRAPRSGYTAALIGAAEAVSLAGAS